MRDDDCEDLGPSPAQMGDTMTVTPGEWTPLDDHGTEIYVYGDQPVDVAVQAAEVGDEIRRLTAERDKAQRERDSLVRRCAARFEEAEKLRADLETMTAVAQGNKRHVADLAYALDCVEALTRDADGNDLHGSEIVVAGKIRQALYQQPSTTSPLLADGGDAR